MASWLTNLLQVNSGPTNLFNRRLEGRLTYSIVESEKRWPKLHGYSSLRKNTVVFLLVFAVGIRLTLSRKTQVFQFLESKKKIYCIVVSRIQMIKKYLCESFIAQINTITVKRYIYFFLDFLTERQCL